MRVLVVAPHPDDEIFGVGGTILRRKAEGCTVAWLIVTHMAESAGWTPETIRRREAEIERVRTGIGCDFVFNLGHEPARLDTVSGAQLVQQFGKVFTDYQPNEVFLPHRSDAHTDHRAVFDAGEACTKWFRYPFVQRVLAYETLSETDAALPKGAPFQPQYFSNIEAYLEQKIALAEIYASELAAFPFPRSVEAIRALAKVRGAASGFMAAEAFELLRERC